MMARTYGDLDTTVQKEAGRDLDLLPIFPSVFAIACSLISLPPLVKLYRVYFDSAVNYWFSGAGQMLLFLPLVSLACSYIIHKQKRGPNRLAVLLGLLVTTFLILLLGDHLLMRAMDLGNKFSSTDCETFTAKREMQREWQAASDFHASCTVHGDTPPGSYMIDECLGYEAALAEHPGWPYLEVLEERNACGGWCETSDPLWTLHSGARLDTCSAVVAEMMFSKVQHAGMQVVVYSIIIISLCSVSLISVGPDLRSRGFDW